MSGACFTHGGIFRLGCRKRRSDGADCLCSTGDEIQVGYISTPTLCPSRCWDTWCSLATSAALVLIGHGLRVKELYGGIAAWETLRMPEEEMPRA